MADNIQMLLVRIINILLGVAVFLLGARVVLRLFNANEATPFVSWIYAMSGFLIAPFRGILENPMLNNGAVLDVVALIAMVSYMILAYIVIAIITAIGRSMTHSHDEGYAHHSHA